MKLSTYCEVLEKKGTIPQKKRLEIEVEYCPEEDSVEEVYAVYLYINDNYKGEISNLLDKCEGRPLDKIIDAIDWRELYRNQLTEKSC